MIIDIYKTIRAHGFTSKGQDLKTNKRLGIKRSFINGKYYIEIYKERWGFSVHLYGGGFMSGYFQTVIDITDKNDVNDLKYKIDIEFKC